MNKYGRQLFIIREWGQKLGFNIEIWKCLQEYYGLENINANEFTKSLIIFLVILCFKAERVDVLNTPQQSRTE